jgi:hypothetical protein
MKQLIGNVSKKLGRLPRQKLLPQLVPSQLKESTGTE